LISFVISDADGSGVRNPYVWSAPSVSNSTVQ